MWEGRCLLTACDKSSALQSCGDKKHANWQQPQDHQQQSRGSSRHQKITSLQERLSQDEGGNQVEQGDKVHRHEAPYTGKGKGGRGAAKGGRPGGKGQWEQHQDGMRPPHDLGPQVSPYAYWEGCRMEYLVQRWTPSSSWAQWGPEEWPSDWDRLSKWSWQGGIEPRGVNGV